MFKRKFENEELLVITNFYKNEYSIQLDFDIKDFICILSNNSEEKN